jgi:hypothetical protein
MRNRAFFGLLMCVALMAVPSTGVAGQGSPSPRTLAKAIVSPETPWSPSAVGAALGMLIAPRAFCGGGDDTECATIVRVAVGLPAIAGGIGVGALVDGLMSRRDAGVSGIQVSWKF